MGPRRLILKATGAIGRAAKAAKAARAAKSAKAREQREAVDVGPIEDAVALESPNMERGLELERAEAAIAEWEARPQTRLYEQLKAKIAVMKSHEESNKKRIADLTEQSAILKQALNVEESKFKDRVARSPLSTEFPAEFSELSELVKVAKQDTPYGVYDESYGRDWIQFHLWGIVRRYRAIYAPDSQYPAQIGEIIKSATRVIPHLDQMIGALDNLDSTNRQLVMHAIGETSPILLQPNNYQTFVNGLRESRALISSCEDGLRLATDIRPENPRTPPVRYVFPAIELDQLWVFLTGQMPLCPKGSALGKHGEKVVAVQPSARFIQLAFKMIDPTIPFETVMTAARNAFDARSQLARNDQSIMNDAKKRGVIDAAKSATIFQLRMAAGLIYAKEAAEATNLDDAVEFARQVINSKA